MATTDQQHIDKLNETVKELGLNSVLCKFVLISTANYELFCSFKRMDSYITIGLTELADHSININRLILSRIRERVEEILDQLVRIEAIINTPT